MTMPSSRVLCVGVLVLGLTACAGGTSTSTPPLANAPASAHKVKATIRITIPKHGRRRVLIRGHYISPATQSITIAVTPVSGPVVNYNADLTPATNSQCQVGIVSPLICTVTLSLAPGTYTATFATYDGLLTGGNSPDNPPSGSVLSANQNVQLNVVVGQANQISVSLGGVPTSVLLVPLGSLLHGDAVSGYNLQACFTGGQVQVLGQDAEGNVIVGPGAPVPTLASGDPTHLAILATPAPSAPNTFALSRAANPSVNSVVQLTAGVTPDAGSGAVAVTQNFNVTFSNTICSLYTTDLTHGRVDEIYANYGSFPASPTHTAVASITNPTDIALDASGNLYATSENLGTVQEVHAVGGVIPASPTVTPVGSGFTQPEGIAVDSSGNVFVADGMSNAIHGVVYEVAPNGSTSTIATGYPFGGSGGLALDSSGNVYVGGYAELYEIVAPGYTTVKNLVNNFSGYVSGIAVDASGDVFVSDNGAVKEVIAVNGSIPASPSIKTLGSFSNALGVAVDPSGNVYVAEFNNSVVEMLAVGGSIPASPTIVTLLSSINPYGIALR
jgi:hypothetical protein